MLKARLFMQQKINYNWLVFVYSIYFIITYFFSSIHFYLFLLLLSSFMYNMCRHAGQSMCYLYINSYVVNLEMQFVLIGINTFTVLYLFYTHTHYQTNMEKAPFHIYEVFFLIQIQHVQTDLDNICRRDDFYRSHLHIGQKYLFLVNLRSFNN